MGLKTRMFLAISLLFGLLFAFLMGITYYFYYRGAIGGLWIIILPLGFAIGIVLLQWAISPYILRWVYRIQWVNGYSPEIDAYIDEVVRKYNIKKPRLGIVRDKNPNAFCFGWTRNKSFLVITEGILHYCDEDEAKAVVGHEMGHIIHNDFVVMTVVAAIPLVFYIIFRGALTLIRSSSRSRGRSAGQAALFAAAVAAVSFLIYILSQLIALLISRYREYWADRFSAETTGNPNKLSSALVKIAYGLASEGGGRAEKSHRRYENALMIFNAGQARALAVNATGGGGYVDKKRIKKAMAWDLWNPWAFFIEMKSTHPLPAKRILALNRLAERMGKMPYVKFDLRKPESYWDEFIEDLLISKLWVFSFPVAAAIFLLYLNLMWAVGSFFLFLGASLLVYFLTLKYPLSFKERSVGELLEDIKVSPVRSRPVILKGRIIGRGVPGLFYSEDLKLDDGTGLVLLDYHQIANFIDFLVGLFGTEEKIGRDVEVWGWYRRVSVPYVEIYKMNIAGRWKKIYTQKLYYAVAIVLLLLGVPFFLL